jgi:hypothetical protein
MKKVGLFVTVTLGILTAFGPFVTDFYLPFLPEMSRSFHTSPSAVSTSLTAGMVGLAALCLALTLPLAAEVKLEQMSRQQNHAVRA